MTSPRVACAGRLIKTRAIGLSSFGTTRQRHDDIGAVGPEAAVAEPGDRYYPLRVGKADARRYGGLAGSRPKVKRGDIGLRVFRIEDVDAGDVIGLGHRALDRDGEWHGVA